MNRSFQVLHSKGVSLPCLHHFVYSFPLEGLNWKEGWRLDHNNVGWEPSYFSSYAKSARHIFGLKFVLNSVRRGRIVKKKNNSHECHETEHSYSWILSSKIMYLWSFPAIKIRFGPGTRAKLSTHVWEGGLHPSWLPHLQKHVIYDLLSFLSIFSTWQQQADVW